MAYLTIGTGVASMAYFAPTIVSGLGYEGLNAQLFTVPPYAIAYPVTLLAAWLSDRQKDRGVIATLACVCACISFIIQGKISTNACHPPS